MKRKLTALGAILISPLLNFMIVAQPVMVKAQENQQQNQPAQQQQSEEQIQSNDTYDYVAQAGDSYSVLARKAVQTYGLENKVNLSQAQIIAAETNLTVDANSPLLNEGDELSFDKAVVKQMVDDARELTTAQQALWQSYVVGVDFDTRDNGE